MMIMEFCVHLQSWKTLFSTLLRYNGETYHVVTPTGHLPTTGGHLTIRAMGFSRVLSTASFSHSCRGQGIGYYQAGTPSVSCLPGGSTAHLDIRLTPSTTHPAVAECQLWGQLTVSNNMLKGKPVKGGPSDRQCLDDLMIQER